MSRQLLGLPAGAQQRIWWKGPPALREDGAPSASLGHPRAQAAPAHPGTQPERRGGVPGPQQLASARLKVEESALSTHVSTPQASQDDRLDCAARDGAPASGKGPTEGPPRSL
jgi:hypothetical protein